jgi:hypothetical protein
VSLLINPHLACCERCGWEIAVGSHTEKQKREQIHAERVHMATTDAVTGLVTADPSHASDVAEIVAAIELDASANSGEVNPNRVRLLLPAHVQPQVIGAVYSRLLRERRLTEIGWTTNTDRRGRNDGKPIRLYELRRSA